MKRCTAAHSFSCSQATLRFDTSFQSIYYKNTHLWISPHQIINQQLQRWQIIFLLHQSPIPLFPTKCNYHLIQIQGSPYPWCSRLLTSVALTYNPNRFKDPNHFHSSSTHLRLLLLQSINTLIYKFFIKKSTNPHNRPLFTETFIQTSLLPIYTWKDKLLHIRRDKLTMKWLQTKFPPSTN